MVENKLLHLIEKDALLSHTDLASVLNLSVEQVTTNIEQFEAKGIICGRHTLINWEKANQEKVKAVIQVCCSPEREFGYDRIAKKIYKFDEVHSMSLLSGSSAEFLVSIEGKTMQEIAHFVGSKLAPIVGVTSTSTLFILKEYKKDGCIMIKENDDEDQRLLVTP